MESFKFRFTLIISVLLLGAYWLAPSLVKDEKKQKWFMGSKKLTYGLDIQGGLHLVMGVDVESVVKEATHRLSTTLKQSILENKKINLKGIEVTNPTLGEMKVFLNSPNEEVVIIEFLESTGYNTQLQVIEKKPEYILVRYIENYLNHYKSRVIEQSIETLRNRIDEFGVNEPSISALGKDRILVQLPGIKDAQRAKDLIQKTAHLEFMMLSDDVKGDQVALWVEEAEKNGKYKMGTAKSDISDGITYLKYTDYLEKLNLDLKDKLPKDTMILFIKDERAKTLEDGKMPVVVKTDPANRLDGSALKDAYVAPGEFGKVNVHFSLETSAAVQFATLTEKNVKKPMAIVLDKVVKSYPIIDEKIPNGSGQIRMGGSSQDEYLEAQLLSTALRAGALPAALEQLEERTVKPQLGQDSINKGKRAAIIGIILVLIFMVAYYRVFGLVADIALILNLFLTLAVLASFGATLTLPGIAGFALTAGMAVDANVLIFERIRDELRKGTALLAAIKEGYSRAFSAIFDGNITTVATCLVLMYYGSGPIKGFAVSLTIGLAASMFTAIYVTRTLIEALVSKFKMQNAEVLLKP